MPQGTDGPEGRDRFSDFWAKGRRKCRQRFGGRKGEYGVLYPRIGIPRLGSDLYCLYMQYKYVQCLRKAGAVAEILAPEVSAEYMAEIIERCDGLLFPGGPDIQPKLYGREEEVGCGKADRMRDAFEFSLLGAALETGKPLFCICRGMQLLNVVLGGTLYQDIKPRQKCKHWDFWNRASATHSVEVDTDSLLSRILGTDTASVNSIHHQAVDDVGKRLWIAAGSPDGFPEALEIEDYPFCLAVQWHPEHMAARTPAQQKLFQAFVDACRQ